MGGGASSAAAQVVSLTDYNLFDIVSVLSNLLLNQLE